MKQRIDNKFRSAKVGGASAGVAALRDVLRHLEHPEVLSRNELVARFMAGREPANAAARIRRLLERMASELPSRRREIVRRCDLQGQSHASVAAALAISRRQFYRDREAALSTIAGSLEAALDVELAAACTVRRDAIELHLCYADAAHQGGQLPSALQLLRDTSAGTAEPNKRVRLECRLAEYYCEAGLMGEAHARIRIAREISSRSDASDAESAARIDAVDATIAWRSGDVASAVRAAEGAVSILRPSLRKRSSPEDAEAVALALLVLGERQLALGNVLPAQRKALEASEALSTADSRRAALAARAAAAATTAIMFDIAHLGKAALELERQYRTAVDRGLTLESTLIGLRSCTLHRFAEMPRQAAAALEDILPIGRLVLTAEDRAGMCIDLASAYVACGEAAKARRALAEARTHAVPGSYVLTLSYIVEADACLLDRAYGAALRMSDAAAVAMQHFDRNQSVGHALRISADAQYALGRADAAKELIGAALERLGAAHPFVSAQIHRSAARITGRRAHRRVAAEISSTLCAAVVARRSE